METGENNPWTYSVAAVAWAVIILVVRWMDCIMFFVIALTYNVIMYTECRGRIMCCIM